MTAIAELVFRITSLQEQPRLFVTFLVQIMQQRRVGLARQLMRQFIQSRESRKQVWFGVRRGHGPDLVFQLEERGEDFFFNRRVHTLKIIGRAIGPAPG